MQSLTLKYLDECRRDFESEFSIAQEACRVVVEATVGRDFSALERRSPGLRGFDWASYINLSMLRMVRALKHISKFVAPGAHVLDFGSYFGNFSLMLAAAGYRVTALDSYAQYGECLSGVCDLMRQKGIAVVESAPDFHLGVKADGFDGVLLMGVIEHIPHTPRVLLEAIRSAMADSAVLVLDTPNLAYIYNRLKLSQGKSIYPPVQFQYFTELPFEGHHREYTMEELDWILDTAGFDVQAREFFNYSIYGLTEVSGQDLKNYHAMEVDPSMRELLMCVARKSCSSKKC